MDAALPFGQLVRQRRLGLQLTQAELAQRVGCATDMVRKIEAGRRRPSAQVAALLAEQLGVAPHEREAFVRLARRQAEAPAESPARANAPPADPTLLIGREADIDAVRARLLRPETRLLTLVGPGGVGKTRLAARVASACAATFRDGACWLALDAVRDPALVLPAIAHALGLREAAAPFEALCNALRGRELLLALDNMEHLLDAAPQLARLVEACPQLRLLATSREPLRLRGEQVYPVGALALSSAVALFVTRARAIDPGFSLADADADTVAALCRRLDGLPLAIELAAARVRALTPAALLAQAGANGASLLGLLGAGPRDAAPRHQSLWNTLAWSYDLLPPAAQRLLRVTGVCVGATPELLAALLEEKPQANAAPALLDSLDALVGASMLRRANEGAAPRFELLDTVRAFALAQLERCGQAVSARRRHAAWCIALAERAAGYMRGPEQEAWLDRLEGEHGNLCAALDWLLAQGGPADGLRLAVALAPFWSIRGYYGEGSQWLGRALAVAEGASHSDHARADALTALARLLRRRSQYDEARARVESALALWRELGDKRGLAEALAIRGVIAKDRGDAAAARADLEASRTLWAELGDRAGLATVLNDLGNLTGDEGDYAAANALYAQSLQLWRASGDRRGVAIALNNLGIRAAVEANYAQAHTYFAESLAIARVVGNRTGSADSLMNLGQVAQKQGDYAAALARFRECLALHNALGDQYAVAATLDFLAELAVAERRMARAARLMGTAAALRAQIGIPVPPCDLEEQQQLAAAARAALDEGAFTSAFDAGYATPIPVLIAQLNRE